VIAIGGAQQFPHFIPVACEVQRRGKFEVTIFVPSREEACALARLARKIKAALPEVVIMDLPPGLAAAPMKLHKVLRMLNWSRRLRACEAMLCAERTSTLLKRLPGRCPPLIHIPHGAGDRAVGFEKRFSLFDHVIVAGPKDRDRLIGSGVVAPTQCDIGGPVKIAAMLKSVENRPSLFSNQLPTILYNPHFKRSLGSADMFVHPLVDLVLKEELFNLIIAPHVRLSQGWSEAKRREWNNLSVPGRIAVDLGSERSIDMTYTLGSDIYIGDVSSQVYEFCIRPRPCIFVNAHSVKWRGDESFAMWNFGEVIEFDHEIGAALGRAVEVHGSFRQVQLDRAKSALMGLKWNEDDMPCFEDVDPIIRSAELVEATAFKAAS
jgi:hypothetical protein